MAESHDSFSVHNPRTGALLYRVTPPAAPEIDAVFERAHRAFPQMRDLSVRDRLARLGRVKDWIQANKESIVQRVVEETGKPRIEALMTEVFPALDLIQYYEKHAARILRDQPQPTPLVLMGKKSRIQYEPLGPVLIISPWNYPFNLSMTPIITALAAGNSVVFKPSEHTPLQGLLEEVFSDAGLPEGAVQVVYGGKETGSALIARKPAKIFFTGSDAAGRAILKQAADDLIPVELELGGKDPMVVFEDVCLPRAVQGALWGAMTNSGQTCTSVERIFVQDRIAEQFVSELRAAMERLTISRENAPTLDRLDLDLGCMTAAFQLDKVERQVEDAVRKGATVVCGGQRIPGTRVFPPTLITGVTPEMAIHGEETFGPVVTVTPFAGEAEAIALANDSRFGLSASVWSGDPEQAERVARAIVTGNVSINNVLATQGNSALPFGGTKHSGMGRYKGPHGLYSFSNVKSVLVDKNSGRKEPIWYPYTAEKYQLISDLIDASVAGGLRGLLNTVLVGLRLSKFTKP